MVVRGHPIGVAVVLAVVAATGAVFLFARPQYRPPGGGKAVSGVAYPAPAESWAWGGGLPGDGVSADAKDFLLAGVTRAELASAQAAAARAGVDPATVRPLRVARYAPGPQGFAAILAGRGGSGRTCLGFVVPGRAPSFLCPDTQEAFVIATATAESRSAIGAGYGTFLLGIASGEVERASIAQHTASTDARGAVPHVVRGVRSVEAYDRSGGWWGTFAITLSGDRPWEATMTLSGAHGRLATLPIRMRVPGSRLFVAR